MGLEVSEIQQSEAELELTRAWNTLAHSSENWLMECKSISDVIATLATGMKAFKTDAENLREFNANLTKRIVEIIDQ